MVGEGGGRGLVNGGEDVRDGGFRTSSVRTCSFVVR